MRRDISVLMLSSFVSVMSAQELKTEETAFEVPEVEVKILPTERLTETENRLTSKMDALGAIRFAEKFLQTVYDYDFSTMKSMICPHPDVQSFFY